MTIFYTHLINKKLEKHVFWIKLLHLLDLKKQQQPKSTACAGRYRRVSCEGEGQSTRQTLINVGVILAI